MTKIGQAFVADDYVVRYGMRGFLAALLGLAVWTVLAVIVVAARAIFPSVPAAVALAMGELGLLAACGRRTAPGRQAGGLFAVHSDGVYFGSGPAKEDVRGTGSAPWSCSPSPGLAAAAAAEGRTEIGRASCRERV